jgi:hypothetical protein
MWITAVIGMNLVTPNLTLFLINKPTSAFCYKFEFVDQINKSLVLPGNLALVLQYRRNFGIVLMRELSVKQWKASPHDMSWPDIKRNWRTKKCKQSYIRYF